MEAQAVNPEILWSRVNKKGPVPAHRPDLGPCWLWEGPTDIYGYGDLRRSRTTRRVHILAYLALVGEVPAGLQLDHLCRVRRCCNPVHLEPVTQQVNIERGEAGVATGRKNRAKTQCPQGHAYDEANTVLDPRRDPPGRSCRACAVARTKQWKLRRVSSST